LKKIFNISVLVYCLLNNGVQAQSLDSYCQKNSTESLQQCDLQYKWRVHQAILNYMAGNAAKTELYESQINAVRFPMDQAIYSQENITSSNENPFVIRGGSGPVYINIGAVRGPWLVASQASINVNSIAQWPFISAPVIIHTIYAPPGLPRTSPGISCTSEKEGQYTVVMCVNK
jgi:hypothetical protein